MSTSSTSRGSSGPSSAHRGWSSGSSPTPSAALKPHSLAARYAAKEALIKALGGSDGVHWTEIEIASEASGRPHFSLTGSTAAVIAERGITALHLSMSHDAGLATAYVIAEAAPQTPVSPNQGNRAETKGDVTGVDEDPLSRPPVGAAAPTPEGAE